MVEEKTRWVNLNSGTRMFPIELFYFLNVTIADSPSWTPNLHNTVPNCAVLFCRTHNQTSLIAVKIQVVMKGIQTHTELKMVPQFLLISLLFYYTWYVAQNLEDYLYNHFTQNFYLFFQYYLNNKLDKTNQLKL